MSYLDKYLKYKNKYLQLKKQIGSGINCDDISKFGLNNRIGSCWNVTIQTVMFYGDPYRDEIQEKLEKFSSETIINNAIKNNNLELLLPSHLLDENNKILDSSKKLLVDFIEDFKKRFLIKIEDSYNNKIDSSDTNKTKLNRRNSFTCEIDFVTKFFNLYKINKETYGGSFYDSKKLFNLLYVTLVNRGIDLLDILPFQIIDLKEIKKSFSIEIIIKIDHESHAVTFFKCNGAEKFCNNNKIIDYKWSSFFEKLIDLNKNKINYKIKLHKLEGPIIFFNNKLYKFAPTIIEKDIDDEYLDCIGDIIYFILITEDNIEDILVNDTALWKTNDDLENIKFIIKLKILNNIDKNGETVLMRKIKSKQIKLVKEILKYNPDLNIQDNYGKTALMIAIECIKDNNNIQDNIKENNNNIQDNIKENNIDNIQDNIKENNIDNIQDNIKENITNIYNYNKFTNEINKNKYTNPITNIYNYNKFTNEINKENIHNPNSSIENKIEIVSEILKYYLDINIQDKDGKTALDIANIKNNKEIIEVIKNYSLYDEEDLYS